MFSNPKVRVALEAGEVGAWRWSIEADHLEWSPNLAALHGVRPDQVTGVLAFFLEDVHPDDRARVREAVDRAVSTKGPYGVRYRLPPAEDGTCRWMEARGQVIEDSSGETVLTGACLDVTAQVRAETELAARLRQQELVAEIGQFALEVDDLSGVFDRAVRRIAEVLEVDYAKVLELQADRKALLLRSGVGWRDGLVGSATVGTELDSQAGYTLMVDAPVVVEDLSADPRFRGPRLLEDHGVVSGMSVVILGPGHDPYGVLGVHSRRRRRFTDYEATFLRSIANVLASAVQRHDAETMRSFLFKELNHRVANQFSQVLTIHRQTARTSRSLAELSEKFENRLSATATAHNLISAGPMKGVAIDVLLRTLVEPYGGNLALDGPSLWLPSDVAFPLSLAVNELATNAAKYGALACGSGSLSVRWQADGDTGGFALEWTETCDRPVSEPATWGFGWQLIELMVVQRMGGTIRQVFEADGLRLKLGLPLTAPIAGPKVEPIA